MWPCLLRVLQEAQSEQRLRVLCVKYMVLLSVNSSWDPVIMLQQPKNPAEHSFIDSQLLCVIRQLA